MNPAAVTGVDFSKNAVAFCQKRFDLEGLSFRTGDAACLPFADGRFDVVVNVECSRCFGAMAPFLSQVKRVLAPGGYFLFADFRARSEIHALLQDLNDSGLAMVEKADITANVLAALDLDDDRKIREIDRRIASAIGLSDGPRTPVKKGLHRLLVGFAAEFTGTRGSSIYREFQHRSSIYISCVMKKQ